MMVVFAIEPRTYRQVMGQAIQALRPHVEVVVPDPETLDTDDAAQRGQQGPCILHERSPLGV